MAAQKRRRLGMAAIAAAVISVAIPVPAFAAELRTNTAVLARLAKLAKLPLITTASEPNGPNGPIMPEIKEVAPDAIYVPRKGEISAWDNEDFVKTVKSTGRKTLVIAGVWTSVCVAFPALQAKAEGYNVYFVTDASGDPSPMASAPDDVADRRISWLGMPPFCSSHISQWKASP